jgi:glucose-1-phosphate cytidylyltransferase
MKAVILAGGMGTRLSEETEVRPKPMIEIGGRPILWHIMKNFAQHGVREFIVALGYKGDMIKRYFSDYSRINADFTVQLRSGDVMRHQSCDEDWTVHLVDTGLATMTGGRLKRLGHLLRGETFMLTYGDGLADVNVPKLIEFHRKHKRMATVTAVRPPARYGSLIFDGDEVASFQEKPQMGEGWINGGFFVLESSVLEYIREDATHWEREPLERLTAERQLMAHRHEGFWQSCGPAVKRRGGTGHEARAFRLVAAAGVYHGRVGLCGLVAGEGAARAKSASHGVDSRSGRP